MPESPWVRFRRLFTGRPDTASATTSELNTPDYFSRQQKEELRANLHALENEFGKDFLTFFYSQGKNNPLTEKFFNILGYSEHSSPMLNNQYWDIRHPFNFPGPFYTGETDTCGTGDIEAPMNVLYDGHTMEYVFRQPGNYTELLCLINAGAVEVFDGYSCNGNACWTYNACRDWWANRGELLNSLNSAEFSRTNGDRVQLYIEYLNTEAERDLRKYCYFLENNKYPQNDAIILPEL